MRFRGILLTVVVLVALVFAVANWTALTEPLPIDFLILSVTVPLGLVLLLSALLLSVLFFFASLLDRAAHLRRLNQLERSVESLQAKLAKRRQDELVAIERAYRERSDALEGLVKERVDAAAAEIRGALADFEMRTKERIEHVESRVALVRDELAADIGEAEDLIVRRLDGDRTGQPVGEGD